MNFSIIAYIIGWILNCEAAIMILPCITAIVYRESQLRAFLITMALCLALGIPLVSRSPKNRFFFIREGFVAVALSWIVLSIMGSLPFLISGTIPNVIDALFETVSGFTTTGASILPAVEPLPRSILFWRSFTHWIGGMGVLVFILAILPMTGGSQMSLMKAESPGPSVEKLVPKVKNTAMILYGIYTAMTLLEIILLFATGMPLFDSLTLSFGTAGTGGFGIRNDSIGGYAPHLQVIITVFMILFGVNFNVYYLMLCKKFRQVFHSQEVLTYLGIILASGLIIAFNIRHIFPNPLEALRHAFFQVGSIITTTGYGTTDFNVWPQISKTLLVMLMFIGACAGSTGGGIKVSRIIIMLKSVIKELFTIVHPRAVRKIKMDGRSVEHDTLRAVNVFVVAYAFIFFFSLLAIAWDNFDFTTNFTAVAATLNNIGPGLEKVGPTANFASFSPFSKYVLMFDMLTGRLEIFPMLILLSPVTWKRR